MHRPVRNSSRIKNLILSYAHLCGFDKTCFQNIACPEQNPKTGKTLHIDPFSLDWKSWSTFNGLKFTRFVSVSIFLASGELVSSNKFYRNGN
mmetsp:Transcript_12806/g.19632  ORF Transcript_12806/g.19632 Transcript_12806/m.19632 type:complete len:92 (+) Transcript_12806:600-875(+)